MLFNTVIRLLQQHPVVIATTPSPIHTCNKGAGKIYQISGNIIKSIFSGINVYTIINC